MAHSESCRRLLYYWLGNIPSMSLNELTTEKAEDKHFISVWRRFEPSTPHGLPALFGFQKGVVV